MNGKLTIIVSDASVTVQGHLSDSNLVDRLAIVDALMNAFEITGRKRELACEMLMHADPEKKKNNDAAKALLGILTDIMDSLKEDEEDKDNEG